MNFKLMDQNRMKRIQMSSYIGWCGKCGYHRSEHTIGNPNYTASCQNWVKNT